MKRIANTLIVVGVWVVSLLVLYLLKVSIFDNRETSIILFSTSTCVFLVILIKTFINRKIVSKEKLYSQIIVILMCFTIVICNLIRDFM